MLGRVGLIGAAPAVSNRSFRDARARLAAQRAYDAAVEAEKTMTRRGHRARGMSFTIVTPAGQVYTGFSSKARNLMGISRQVDASIAKRADDIASSINRGCGAACAEIDAISQALRAGETLQGSVGRAAQIGARNGLNTGQFRTPCGSCSPLLGELGIIAQ